MSYAEAICEEESKKGDKMFNEAQRSFAGRATLAMSAAHAEMVSAIRELAKHDPDSAARAADSAARNLEQAAGMFRLVAAEADAVSIPGEVPVWHPESSRLNRS
jgi:hypothetical protein